MHTLAVYFREARAQIVATWRTPQFLIPSVALPLLFYGVMGLGLSKGREEVAHFMLANYVIFAAIAPAMFGFGAGVAAEREAKLIELKQIAPLPAAATWPAAWPPPSLWSEPRSACLASSPISAGCTWFPGAGSLPWALDWRRPCRSR
jgi:hypothetical protein